MPERVDEAGDATRRTRLANERTYLAWWRTGLTAFAVALGAGKIVPDLTDAATAPWVALGAGFAVLGVLLIGYSFRRQRMVERSVDEGGYSPPDQGVLVLLTIAGIVLGLAILVFLVVQG